MVCRIVEALHSCGCVVKREASKRKKKKNRYHGLKPLATRIFEDLIGGEEQWPEFQAKPKGNTADDRSLLLESRLNEAIYGRKYRSE